MPWTRQGRPDRRGVVQGKATLDAAVSAPPYAVKAMLVLTDGVENTAPLLSAVGSSLTANSFAIGLGSTTTSAPSLSISSRKRTTAIC